jgi:quinol monooxygenase YgiN
MAFAALFQGTAAPEHVDALKRAMATLARESMEEPGTFRYEFYAHEEDPLLILLFAVWESEAHWRANVQGAAHKRFNESLPEGAWAIRPKMTRLQPLDGAK